MGGLIARGMKIVYSISKQMMGFVVVICRMGDESPEIFSQGIS
jgi:hypothetical protein